MKVKVVVTCSCGKKWEDEETPERAESWWKVLGVIEPELPALMEKKGEKETTEMALRILWARHSAYKKERGSKDPHEATVVQETTIETEEELQAYKKEKP